MILTTPDASLPRVLEATDVTVQVGGATIIEGISFWIPRGEFVCLCGPNGAGKSTFLKAVLGLTRPSRGRVEILGKPPQEAREHLGYVPQRKSFAHDFPATAVEVIVAGLRGRWPVRIQPDERDRAFHVLERCGGGRLLDKRMAGLSGGEMQRVFLARALIHNPALIVLDEPTAGMDVRGRAELLELLHEISACDRIAALLVTHNLAAIARTAERIVYLEAGRLVAWGLPHELLGHESLSALAPGAAAGLHLPDED